MSVSNLTFGPGCAFGIRSTFLVRLWLRCHLQAHWNTMRRVKGTRRYSGSLTDAVDVVCAEFEPFSALTAERPGKIGALLCTSSVVQCALIKICQKKTGKVQVYELFLPTK